MFAAGDVCIDYPAIRSNGNKEFKWRGVYFKVENLDRKH